MRASKSVRTSLIWGFVLFSLISVTSCHDEDEAFYFKHNEKVAEAQQICNSHGQQYLQHFFDGSHWEVICITKSPYQSFRYELK